MPLNKEVNYFRINYLYMALIRQHPFLHFIKTHIILSLYDALVSIAYHHLCSCSLTSVIICHCPKFMARASISCGYTTFISTKAQFPHFQLNLEKVSKIELFNRLR